jgi:hypothetical protein
MQRNFIHKLLYPSIVAPLSLAAQGIDVKYPKGDHTYPPRLDFEKLNTLILDKQFYESLELLEPYGFREKTELHILRFMQCGGGI